MPPLTNLRTDNFSHRADEKSSNGFPQRLTGGFRGVSRGATALAIATALTTLSAGFGTQAFAQDNNSSATVQTVSAQNVTVPMRDARGADLYSVRGSAGVGSLGHIIIIFGSSDGKALEQTKDAAREAIASGLPIRGILISDAYPSETVEVWAGTDRYAAEVAPFDNLKSKLSNTLPGAATYAAEDLAIRQAEELATKSASVIPTSSLR